MAKIDDNPRVFLIITHLIKPSPDSKEEHPVFLSGRRGPSCNNANQLGFFGGNVDPGETLTEAVVRELMEETGMTIQARNLSFLFKDLVKAKPVTWYVVNNLQVGTARRRITKEVVDYEWLTTNDSGRRDLHYSVRTFFDWLALRDHAAGSPDAMNLRRLGLLPE